MSRSYKFYPGNECYFTTASIVSWIDIFTRALYKDIIIESLNFCTREKDLNIHAWCLMTNHLHMIISTRGRALGETMRDMKQFTAKRILKELEENKQESRQEWLLWHFERAGRYRAGNDIYQFWQHYNHPVFIRDGKMMADTLCYIHYNPVKAGFVAEPEHWLYSSALDYTGKKGLVDLVMID